MFLPTNYHEIELDFTRQRTTVTLPALCDQCKVKTVERVGRNCETCAAMLCNRDLETQRRERIAFFFRIIAYLITGAAIVITGLTIAARG